MNRKTKENILASLMTAMVLAPMGLASANIISLTPVDESTVIEYVDKQITEGKCSVGSSSDAIACYYGSGGHHGETTPADFLNTGNGLYAQNTPKPSAYSNLFEQWPNFAQKYMSKDEQQYVEMVRQAGFDDKSVNKERATAPDKYANKGYYPDYKIENGLGNGVCKTKPANLKQAVNCIKAVDNGGTNRFYDMTTEELNAYVKSVDDATYKKYEKEIKAARRNNASTDPSTDLRSMDDAAYYAYNAPELMKYATEDEKSKMYTALFMTQDTVSDGFTYIANSEGYQNSLKDAAKAIVDKIGSLGIEQAFVNAANGDPAAMLYLISKYPDFAKRYVTMDEFASIVAYQASDSYDKDKLVAENSKLYGTVRNDPGRDKYFYTYNHINNKSQEGMSQEALSVLATQKDDFARVSVEMSDKVTGGGADAWDDVGIDFSQTIPAVIEKAVKEGKCTVDSVQSAVECAARNYWKEDENGKHIAFDGGNGISKEFNLYNETHAENLLAYICKGYPFMMDYASAKEKKDLEKRMKNLDMAHQAERIQSGICRFSYDDDEAKAGNAMAASDCFSTYRYLPGFKPDWIESDKNEAVGKIRESIRQEDKTMNAGKVAGAMATAAGLLAAAATLYSKAKNKEDLDKAEELKQVADNMIKDIRKNSALDDLLGAEISDREKRFFDAIAHGTVKDEVKGWDEKGNPVFKDESTPIRPVYEGGGCCLPKDYEPSKKYAEFYNKAVAAEKSVTDANYRDSLPKADFNDKTLAKGHYLDEKTGKEFTVLSNRTDWGRWEEPSTSVYNPKPQLVKAEACGGLPPVETKPQLVKAEACGGLPPVEKIPVINTAPSDGLNSNLASSNGTADIEFKSAEAEPISTNTENNPTTQPSNPAVNQETVQNNGTSSRYYTDTTSSGRSFNWNDLFGGNSSGGSSGAAHTNVSTAQSANDYLSGDSGFNSADFDNLDFDFGMNTENLPNVSQDDLDMLNGTIETFKEEMAGLTDSEIQERVLDLQEQMKKNLEGVDYEKKVEIARAVEKYLGLS